MKRALAYFGSALLLLCSLCGCAGGKLPSPPEGEGEAPSSEESPSGGLIPQPMTATPADTSDVLINPGKGFMYYEWEMTEAWADVYATGYHRFNWVDIEPEDNVFDFTKIEKKIKSYAEAGRQFAFGVMSVNTSSSKEYITPKFVFDESGKYDIHRFEGGGVQYIPKWDDEVYLKHVRELAAALGEKYNGDPNISFVGILNYGNWGEQHLFGLNVEEDKNYSENGKVTPEFFRDNYVKPYQEAFPDTLLFNSWGYEDLDGVYEELIDEGVSLRRDGIISYTNGLDTLAKAYGKLPVAFEFARDYSHYADDPERGREYFNRRLEEAIAIAKPSYIELDEEWYRENKEYCEALANRMGYYFRFKRAKYFKELSAGKETEVELSFQNDGVALICEPCTVKIALLDASGTPVRVYGTEISPKTWEPGVLKTEKVKIQIGDVPAGEYRFAVGLFRKDTDALPCYLLGSEGGTADKWCVFAPVTVK